MIMIFGQSLSQKVRDRIADKAAMMRSLEINRVKQTKMFLSLGKGVVILSNSVRIGLPTLREQLFAFCISSVRWQ